MNKHSNSEFALAVYAALKRVPRGRVTTYGDLARAAGKPGAARAVGNALHKNPYAPAVPCHRVVMSDGRLGGFAGGPKKKTALLKNEGVAVENGKIADFYKKKTVFRFC
jgi:methylated-DNA-[protein]-cysteine S-methyltransferase